MLLHHVDDFGLEPDQIEQLNNLMLEFELEKVDKQAALQKAKINWRALIRNVDADETQVMAAIDNVTKAEGDLRKMRYNHLKAARSVLNDGQRNDLKTFHLMQSRQKVAGGGGGGGNGGGGGGGGRRRAG
jgi:hypothetical protein